MDVEKVLQGSADTIGVWWKATSDEPLSQGSGELLVICDPVHAGKRHVREPGDPAIAETLIEASAALAKPEGMSRG